MMGDYSHIYERGNNVEEKWPLSKEPDCLLITPTVSHWLIAITSTIFPHFGIHSLCTIKDEWSFPPFFFLSLFFPQKIQKSIIWSLRWSCSEKKNQKNKAQACCETKFFLHAARVFRGSRGRANGKRSPCLCSTFWSLFLCFLFRMVSDNLGINTTEGKNRKPSVSGLILRKPASSTSFISSLDRALSGRGPTPLPHLTQATVEFGVDFPNLCGTQHK